MLVKWSTFMAASYQWLILKSREWSWKILGQLLRCTLSGGGGGEVELVSIVPTPALLPLAPLRFLNIHSHNHKATLLHPTHTDVRSELVANTVCWGYHGVRCLLEYWLRGLRILIGFKSLLQHCPPFAPSPNKSPALRAAGQEKELGTTSG